MATTSSKTSTRKSSSTRAASSTSTSTRTGDADPDTTTSGEQTDTTADTAGAAAEPTDSDQATTTAQADPAAELKQRVRTTQHIGDTRPDELSDEQRLNLLGAPAGAVGGPRTLATATSPTRKGEEYVTAEADGYVAWVPKYSKQPATIRLWIEGQRIRKDMYDALSGVATANAQDAPVLTGDEYAQVAPYL